MAMTKKENEETVKAYAKKKMSVDAEQIKWTEKMVLEKDVSVKGVECDKRHWKMSLKLYFPLLIAGKRKKILPIVSASWWKSLLLKHGR